MRTPPIKRVFVQGDEREKNFRMIFEGAGVVAQSASWNDVCLAFGYCLLRLFGAEFSLAEKQSEKSTF